MERGAVRWLCGKGREPGALQTPDPLDPSRGEAGWAPGSWLYPIATGILGATGRMAQTTGKPHAAREARDQAGEAPARSSGSIHHRGSWALLLAEDGCLRPLSAIPASPSSGTPHLTFSLKRGLIPATLGRPGLRLAESLSPGRASRVRTPGPAPLAQ